MSVRLHINVDHVATVRNARGTRYPDPVFAARICEAAGADGITAHLREDRRHIVDDDVSALRAAVATMLNLEMAATDEMIAIAERVKPDVISLVPERREERTTEGGLDIVGQRAAIASAVAMARRTGIRVSLFINPRIIDVERSAEAGVQQVELHTGEYCNAAEPGRSRVRAHARVGEELERIASAARRATELGLEVAAGHGLHRHNVGPVVAIPEVREVNIGHSVIADAVFFGLERAVRDLRAAVVAGIEARPRMIPVLSRAQMRAFDKYAIEACHVPGIVLMENAGRGAADVISAMIEARSPARPRSRAVYEAFPVRHVKAPGQPAVYPLDARVVVVCGAGNNGGDGFVVARHLLSRGAEVRVFLAGSSEKVMGESRVNHDAYIDLGGVFDERAPPDKGGDPSIGSLEAALANADVVVDALFGTGLDRPIQGHVADVIAAINRSAARCVALDIPSGLDADSGAPLGIAVEADDTVTFGHLKIGLLTPEGARLAGNIHVVDLGVPESPILAQVGHLAEVIRRETIGSSIAPRETNVHKHAAGDVLVVAGSAGKVGSSLLTARGALRAGAGLVTICSWPDAIAALQARVVEVMTAGIDPEAIAASLDEALARRTAVAIGPGLGLDALARAAVDHVVLGWEGVKVVDADAITHFVGRAEALASAKGQCILTPHPGELGRLLGKSGSAVERDRFGAVRDAVARTRAIIVLKGARTIIATPEGRMYISMAGNPALATAGAGDVLTGIIVALACSMSPVQAACAGVLVHALAGDRWRARTGSDRGMLAGEISESVPSILAALARGDDPLED